MTPQRRDQLLQGQSGIAKKVYEATPCGSGVSATVYEVAQAMKKATGAATDIRTLRGCLSSLRESGLIKEVVPGSFRQVDTRDGHVSFGKTLGVEVGKMVQQAVVASKEGGESRDTLDMLGGLSERLRGLAASAGRLADDIDAAALSLGERFNESAAEVVKVRQIATLLKELG